MESVGSGSVKRPAPVSQTSQMLILYATLYPECLCVRGSCEQIAGEVDLKFHPLDPMKFLRVFLCESLNNISGRSESDTLWRSCSRRPRRERLTVEKKERVNIPPEDEMNEQVKNSKENTPVPTCVFSATITNPVSRSVPNIQHKAPNRPFSEHRVGQLPVARAGSEASSHKSQKYSLNHSGVHSRQGNESIYTEIWGQSFRVGLKQTLTEEMRENMNMCTHFETILVQRKRNRIKGIRGLRRITGFLSLLLKPVRVWTHTAMQIFVSSKCFEVSATSAATSVRLCLFLERMPLRTIHRSRCEDF